MEDPDESFGLEPFAPLHPTSQPRLQPVPMNFPEELFGLPLQEARDLLDEMFEKEYAIRLMHQNNNLMARSAMQAGTTHWHWKRVLRRHGIIPPKDTPK